jgi:hypothetical protein
VGVYQQACPRALAKLNKKDRELFEFSMQNFNWDSYFYTYVRGARAYILKDPLSTLPEGEGQVLQAQSGALYSHNCFNAASVQNLDNVVWISVLMLIKKLFVKCCLFLKFHRNVQMIETLNPFAFACKKNCKNTILADCCINGA